MKLANGPAANGTPLSPNQGARASEATPDRPPPAKKKRQAQPRVLVELCTENLPQRVLRLEVALADHEEHSCFWYIRITAAGLPSRFHLSLMCLRCVHVCLVGQSYLVPADFCV